MKFGKYDAKLYDLSEIDLSKMKELLFHGGVYKLPHYKDLASFDTPQLAVFGNKYGMYTIPTIELIDELKKIIAGRHAVEIGSGVGIIGRELGIKCTDSLCQNIPAVKMHYDLHLQPVIEYGTHVIERDAEWVARKWRPDVILGSWITHKYVDEEISGNFFGPDEEIILDNCKTYIMLGNHKTHGMKPIMKHNPMIIKDFPGYVSRSSYPEDNRVYIWEGRKK
jgi:hypothetical protein